MCFSAEASLITGAVLIPAGAYCLGAAWRKDRTYLALAIIPLLFGVQQLFEAAVWVGLERGDDSLVKRASLGFLFFAIAFWPAWVPFSAAAIERRPGTRRLFGALAVLGLALGSLCYVPAAASFGEWVEVGVVNHSVRYDFSRLPAAQTAVGWTWAGLYLAAVCVPLLLSHDRRLRLLGVTIGASATVSHLLFWFAFASVWCFFAALLSLQICYILRRIPEPAVSEPSGSS